VTALHAIERAMAVPMKRFERPLLGHLTRPEMIAVLGQPGTEWTSQRDHLLLSLLYNTGARVSEIVGVRVVDVVLDGSACVHLHGKGRKDRSVPLWKSTAAAIRAWLHARSAPPRACPARRPPEPCVRAASDARRGTAARTRHPAAVAARATPG
jgi:site-specific recombinase XerD